MLAECDAKDSTKAIDVLPLFEIVRVSLGELKRKFDDDF